MSMMMPPDPNAAPGLPLPPGGGPDVPPRDVTPPGPMPGGGGMDALAAILGGGAPPPPDGGPATPDDQGQSPIADMTSTDHIREAMKHLMMALAVEPDESQGAGIVKGMGALQGILGGAQKKDQQLAQLGGPPGGGQ